MVAIMVLFEIENLQEVIKDIILCTKKKSIK